jgi:hypothetical protein
MKVLKYTGIELGDTEYIEETLGLNDALSMPESLVPLLEEIGLNDFFNPIIEEFLTEDIGLNDVYTVILSEEIIETLGLGDLTFTYDRVDLFETLGLGDTQSESMSLYVEINENIGFTDIGVGESYAYLEMDYQIRWRTRTKKSTFGFGGAPYGTQSSYGEGDVIGELKEFKVKVIRLSDSTVLRTDTITIVNKLFPDGSAQYVYTVAMNETDNGYYEPNLRFEVYQVDINDVWSPADYLDITASTFNGDLE